MKTKLLFFLLLILAIGFQECQSPNHGNVKIGSILSLTGKMSNYGNSSKAALRAINDIINKDRKEKGFPPFELVIEDDKLEPKSGVDAAQKLIDIDKVSVIIGAQPSSVTLAIAPIAESKKTVVISPASTTTDLTIAGDYIFRTVLSGEYEGNVSADLYKQHYNGKKLAVLYINNDYGLSLKKVFLSSVGVADVLEVAYSEKDVDFKTYLTKIKDAGTEVVYILGYNEMVMVFKQAKEMGMNVNWIGAAQMGNKSLVDKLGTTADGVIFPSWEMNLEAIKTNNAEFYSLFQKYSNNADLDPFAANAVDALSILNVIIKDKPMSGEEIKNELKQITPHNYTGIYPNFK